MTAPSLFCLCAHPRTSHERNEGKCKPSCGCGEYRRASRVTPPVVAYDPGAETESEAS